MSSNASQGSRDTDGEAGAEIALARAAIGRLDFFRSERPGDIAVTRLGGLTNLVFKVDCNGDSYVLRVPGRGTEEYIDRELEAVAAREAARVGVSPEVIAVDPATGILLTQYLSVTTMTPALFKSRPGAVGRVGDVLRRLHTSGAKFRFRFDLFGMIDEYLRIIGSKSVKLPHGFNKTLADAGEVRRALTVRPVPITACHCDPLAENFLDTGRRMWLVDWEFSGMNDPMWDLADVAVEAGFDPRQEAELLAGYYAGATPTRVELGRIALYKAMCDLLWALWGIIQFSNNNPSDDFWTYAERRFERCKLLMADPGFPAHVASVTRG